MALLLIAILGMALARGDTFIQAVTKIAPLLMSVGLGFGRIGELRSELRRIDG
jgi:hypothetical protein